MIQVLDNNENHWFKNSIILELFRRICSAYILVMNDLMENLYWEDMTKPAWMLNFAKLTIQDKQNCPQINTNMVYIGCKLIPNFTGRLIFIKLKLGTQ